MMSNDLYLHIFMTDDSMRMASFRIDREMWAKFSAIAKRERLTATDVLTQYISVCIGNDKTEYDVHTSNDEQIHTDVDTSLRDEIKALAESVLKLETHTQSQFKAVREELKKPLLAIV
jgi:hypothetical protein